MDTNEYTKLIAGYHAEKPRFTQWVFELTEPVWAARLAMSDFVQDFDIDSATGDQLDAVGVRVGLSRNLNAVIEGVFFAFDDVDGVGLDYGIWKTPRDSATAITTMSDAIYRQALKAKVVLNHYDGKNQSVGDLIDAIMSAFGVTKPWYSYVDNQDMTIRVSMKKDKVPPIVWQLFYNEIFKVNHAGVGVTISERVVGVLGTTDGAFLTDQSGNYLELEF